MNEVTRIHLGRQQFVVAVDAHKALQGYLQAIERRVGDDKEVLKEIELRMAELLSERGISGDEVVLPEDIAYLREQLGEPSAFGEGEPEEPAHEKTVEPDVPRRLFRDTDNAMLAGVCSGLGAFFGLDPLLFRLLFVVLTLTGGAGVLIYIVLWLLVPEAKTNSEKLQMRGKAVTVDTLKELVDRAEVEATARRASQKITPILGRIVQIVAAVIGVMFITAAVGGLVGLGSGLTYLGLHHGEVLNGDIAFPVGTVETVFTVGAAVLAAMILVLLCAAGVSLIKRKWALPNWLTAVVGVIMLIALGVASAAAPDTLEQVDERRRPGQMIIEDI